MFYYCELCGQIENLDDDKKTICSICEYQLKQVPKDYLMDSGIFFKSQEARKRLIEFIKSGSNYKPEIAEAKDIIKEQNDTEKNETIARNNAKMKAIEQNTFHAICPICHSKSLTRISNVGKIAKVAVLGTWGAGDLRKTYKCNVCGNKF